MAKSGDMVEELVDAGEGNPGVPGMMTPEEIIAAEEAQAVAEEAAAAAARAKAAGLSPDESAAPAEPGTPGAAASSGEEPAAGEKPEAGAGEVDLDALEKKILAKEELTEAEARLIAGIDKKLEEEPTPQAKSYVVNGQTIPYEDAVKLLRTETTLGDVRVNAKALEILVDNHMAEKNRNVAQTKISQVQRENAAERQRLAEERARLTAERRSLQKQRELVTRQREQVNAILKTQMSKEDVIDPNTQMPDPEKMHKYGQQLAAREQLPMLQEQERQLEEEITATSRALLISEVSGFLEVAPQYKMNEPYEVIAAKIGQGVPVSPEDMLKMREIYRFIEEKRTFGGTLENHYEYAKMAGTLAVKPSAAQTAVGETQPGKAGQALQLPAVPDHAQILADKVRRFREKQKKANVSVGAGGSGDRGIPGQKTAARQLIEVGRRVTGVNDDKFLREQLGFGQTQ